MNHLGAELDRFDAEGTDHAGRTDLDAEVNRFYENEGSLPRTEPAWQGELESASWERLALIDPVTTIWVTRRLMVRLPPRGWRSRGLLHAEP